MKKILVSLLTISLITMMTACSTIETHEVRTTTGDYELVEDEQVNSGYQQFAFKLFAKINEGALEENIFISPYSISMALTMLYNGAEGATKNELAKVLGYIDLEDQAINEGNKYLFEHLQTVDEGVEIAINNSIWLRNDFIPEQAYIDQNTEVFDAYVEQLDFAKDDSVDIINEWISHHTDGMIDEIIQGPIDPLTEMFLINTIYFNGKWTQSFDENLTDIRSFTNLNNSPSSIDMMAIEADFEYAQTTDYRAVRLPYGEGTVSMYCILPEGEMDVNTLIASLTEDRWYEIRESLHTQKDLSVKLPKFKLEYGVKELKKELIALGIEEVFIQGTADLTGIAKNLYTESVLHKAVIEVDENGTKAAVVTVIENKNESIMIEEQAKFWADRPFVFIIADEVDGTILFIGKIVDL